MQYDPPVIICGFPSPAEDYKEDMLNFNEFLETDKPSVYVLRAKGYSMTEAGIFPEDLIVVDRAKEAKHNSLIIASVDGCFTLKRLLLKPRLVLHAENPEYSDIVLHNMEELQVFGVVTAIVRKL